jgi:hypothetical protein
MYTQFVFVKIWITDVDLRQGVPKIGGKNFKAVAGLKWPDDTFLSGLNLVLLMLDYY